MPIPLIGWALIAGLGFLAAACDHKEKIPPENGPSENPEKPCPQGWRKFDVEEGNALRLCLQEPSGAEDRVYQRATDRLALQFEDRFIPADDPRFKSYQERFHLPEWEGLNIPLWAQEYRDLFPQKTNWRERNKLASLLRFCGEKHLDWNKVKQIAAKVGPGASDLGPPRASAQITPMEKIQSLTLVAALMALQKEEKGFYQEANFDGSKENQVFVDAVLKRIEEGQLKIRDWTGKNAEILGGQTDFLIYSQQNNLLEIASELDPFDFKSVFLIVHELYHFYQDSKKIDAFHEEIETQAILKAGEYLLTVYEKGVAQGLYRSPEDFLQKSGVDPSHPNALAFLAQYFKKSGDDKKFKEKFDLFQRELNITYYLNEIFFQMARQAMQSENCKLPEDYDPRNKAPALKKIEDRIRTFSSSRNARLQDLKKFLKTAPKKPDPKFLERMGFLMAGVQNAWIFLIVNQKLKTAIDNHQDPDHIVLSPLDAPERKMLETLADLHPMARIPKPADGVD